MELNLEGLKDCKPNQTLDEAMQPKARMWCWALVEIDPLTNKWNVVKSFIKPVTAEKKKATKKKVIEEFGEHEDEEEIL
jgi:hypothetical protein